MSTNWLFPPQNAKILLREFLPYSSIFGTLESIHIINTRAQLGQEGEALAGRHLVSEGFRILDRNWRRPWGELDIVASKGGVVHFVEVKASQRRVDGFAPELRADWRKMAKVQRTARTWLTAHHYGPDTEWQIDVASVIMGEEGTEPAIEVFPQE